MGPACTAEISGKDYKVQPQPKSIERILISIDTTPESLLSLVTLQSGATVNISIILNFNHYNVKILTSCLLVF